MRRAGTVERAANGVAVVRCDGDPPDVGADLVDERLDPVGEVVDVFGPIDRPYLAVTPAGDDPARHLGTACYVTS